jgi:[ribosomal protein S18]-alanine N-acetyltransferase
MVTLVPHRGSIPADIPAAERDALATTIAIEPGRFRDILPVARLQRKCFRRSLAYQPTTLVMLYLWPRAQFLVARAAGQIVGCVIGDVHGGQSRVISICVDPDWRRRNLGTRLLERIESRLPDGNMILMVEAGNLGAQQLYRNCGYLPVGESANYYGRGRSGIWMQKTRPPTG